MTGLVAAFTRRCCGSRRCCGRCRGQPELKRQGLKRHRYLHRLCLPVFGHDFRVLCALYFQLTQRAFVERTEERVVNHSIAARDVGFKFDNRCATGRDQGALYVFVDQFAAFYVNFVEDFTDNVEGGNEVRPPLPTHAGRFRLLWLSGRCRRR